MEIYLNGQPHQIDGNITVSTLISTLDLTGKRLAIEINEELITRHLFDQHQLQEHDRVEIVQAIGGG